VDTTTFEPGSPVRPSAPKELYRRPRLTVYGDVRALTLSNVSMNMNDTMNGATTRT
jgi:hypothetical protein